MSAVLDPVHALPFPEAALPVLRDSQLRKNVAHAIDVIQAKRARLVAEKTDWQELRSAAARIRDEALENRPLDVHTLRAQADLTRVRMIELGVAAGSRVTAGWPGSGRPAASRSGS